jgi:hypothetical protein
VIAPEPWYYRKKLSLSDDCITIIIQTALHISTHDIDNTIQCLNLGSNLHVLILGSSG